MVGGLSVDTEHFRPGENGGERGVAVDYETNPGVRTAVAPIAQHIAFPRHSNQHHRVAFGIVATPIHNSAAVVMASGLDMAGSERAEHSSEGGVLGKED